MTAIVITPNKTYATRENAEAAVARKLSPERLANQRYFLHTHTDGRYFPVFVGERALHDGIHFLFNVIA